jgi:isochorismate pyruvate lyase
MSAPDRDAVLKPLRDQIDAVDEQMVALVAERMRIVDAVVSIKQANGIPGRLDDRIEAVVSHVRDKADRLGAPPDLAEVLWRTMIEWVIAYEDARLDGE